MEIHIERRLFWFLKEGVKLDVSNKTDLDLYIQQIISRGKIYDVKKLFDTLSLTDFIDSFNRIKRFLPEEVKGFWEEFIGDINQSTKGDNRII